MATKLAELESLLYLAGDTGVEQANLCQLLEIEAPALRELAKKLTQKLSEDENSGLQVSLIKDTYKMTTSYDVADVVEKYYQKDLSKTLSQSALEILAIVAYRQPITRVEIDEIRGVNSAGAIQTLIWRGLVKTSGKKDVPGHPNLYVTTDYFLQYFGYESLADLPVIEDFENESIDEKGQVDLFKAKDSNNPQNRLGER
ncbi:SMC-Scp complex subunit ScpB [Lactobacillus mulieris]|jgi:segregation and condensation protein B|uniref:Segregation and condensation protein B n=1 Tax=Lactobacillus mulieris TaxID=2508708 RepID=A0AAP3GWN0_9LACO|nr:MULTISPECIES: SMC-Scp complex subunit ScpB [Lactobacillus]EEU21255.1 segregation and condensation protein B [Lactobacillus jensenii 27-2-CHN]EEX24130.1 segregation and condensation protein B [Lactobacillus jensenii 115-3-CHN]EFH29312.1 segregation and condensation protein B [Lactobacillus jensenii JV-V16]KAA9245306.1 SMC-Scp complex subunit ScpB [Lactobacillus jensenii]KAA9367017.1 SMC-Scp complex subunit ScpB [Lactobacillus jensenii]